MIKSRRDEEDSPGKKGIPKLKKQVLSRELMAASLRTKKPVAKPVDESAASAVNPEKSHRSLRDKILASTDDQGKKLSAKINKSGEGADKSPHPALSEQALSPLEAAKTPSSTPPAVSAGGANPLAEARSDLSGVKSVQNPPDAAAKVSPAPSPQQAPVVSSKILVPQPLKPAQEVKPIMPVQPKPMAAPSMPAQRFEPRPSSVPKPVINTSPQTPKAAPKNLKPASKFQASQRPAPQKISTSRPSDQGQKSSEEARQAKLSEVKPAEEAPALQSIAVKVPITVRDLANAISVKPTDLIALLIKKGVFATMNQSVGFEMASGVVKEFGFKLEEQNTLEADLTGIHHVETEAGTRHHRPPIVTFMGHVDHGKTSLLDAIRKSKVVMGESGGITQHIGAYEVFLPKGAVTFLDTPGHEAFTAMRARGAQCTDIVVLVIAADSGIMPQTEEAIDHAKAAEVPIVVAINKCDLPSANIDKVKKELMAHELVPEDWGGKTICVPVSAKTGTGLERLLDMLLLEAEMLELKANAKAPARGSVVEAQMSKSSGPLATLLIQDGTLRVSDFVVCGNQYGRVRAMINDHGQRIKEAPPSCPVEILGLSGVPKAGDSFYVVKDESKAKELIVEKQHLQRERSLLGNAHVSLEQLYAQMQAGKVNQLKVVVKADTQGSIEALKSVISQIPSDKIKLQIIHAATGDVSGSDTMLASASDAIIIGFHVSIAPDAEELIRQEQIDVRLYSIIYEAEEALRKALEGMLEPEKIERQVATVEIRQVFRLSKSGAVAGSFVRKGKITRGSICRVFRGGKLIREAKIASLKRFKNDAKEIQEGFECGVSLEGFSDFEPGDEIRAFEIESKASKL